jgi:hypothetical protein
MNVRLDGFRHLSHHDDTVVNASFGMRDARAVLPEMHPKTSRPEDGFDKSQSRFRVAYKKIRTHGCIANGFPFHGHVFLFKVLTRN